jgi:mannose-6-phosphate isomerase class I
LGEPIKGPRTETGINRVRKNNSLSSICSTFNNPTRFFGMELVKVSATLETIKLNRDEIKTIIEKHMKLNVNLVSRN